MVHVGKYFNLKNQLEQAFKGDVINGEEIFHTFLSGYNPEGE